MSIIEFPGRATVRTPGNSGVTVYDERKEKSMQEKAEKDEKEPARKMSNRARKRAARHAMLMKWKQRVDPAVKEGVSS